MRKEIVKNIKKRKGKARRTYTLDELVVQEFEKACRRHRIKYSQAVNDLMQYFVRSDA